MLFAGGVGAQAPGTVKSSSKISARTGSLGQSSIFKFVGQFIGSYPDMDGDGIKELVFWAGAPGGFYGVHIYRLDANGNLKPNPTVLSENNTILSNVSTKYPGNSASYIGSGLTSLKDLNGNGIDELVTTTFNQDNLFILFLNATGGIDSFTLITNGVGGFNAPSTLQSSLFGRSVTNIGDLDNDGVEDLAIGSQSDDGGKGGVYIFFMRSNGRLKRYSYLYSGGGGVGPILNQDAFGSSVSRLGDLDGDGTPDLLVGGATNANLQRGGLWVLFMKPDGTAKSYKRIQTNTPSFPDIVNSGSFFGNAVTNIGDLDGDSVTDVATSAYDYVDNLGGKYGRVYILFLNRDGTLKSRQTIDRFYGNLTLPIDTQAFFGFDLCAMGDVNKDGIPDIAVGAPRSKEPNSTGNPDGAIYLLNLNGIPITTGVGDQLHNLTDSYFLYPNPTSDYIRIRSRKPLATALQVRLLDAAGRTVKMVSGEGNATLEIEVAHLPAGLYNIELTNGKEVQWGKFIKN